jgi:membrane-associated phospholipid phosphatase
MRNMIAAFDRAAVRRIRETDSRLLDLVMPRLSRLANRGLPWIGVASVLRATGDRWARRAAWRGLAAASAATNILGKSLTAQDRPHDKAGARQLNRAPRTSSFPSGHAASAAAFATGVALEKPSLAAPVIIAAAAVGASRVVTGMHYPSEVLAGFTIGAAAGALTLRWWPRRPPVPAAAIRPPRGAPAVPSGEDLVLAVNRSAGTTSAKLVRRLRAERLLDRIDTPHLARVRAARAAARERA